MLVFDVQENRPHLRFGVGYEDFSSWYLLPAQLNADNLTGHGEALRLSARVGYRVAGVDLTLRSTADAAARDFLAGMTDRYAVRLFEQLYVPKPWAVD